MDSQEVHQTPAMEGRPDKTALPAGINRRLGRAFHDWRMLSPEELVLVAVSGGVDSLVLCWLLSLWRRKTPFDFQLLAVHLDMGFDPSGATSRRVAAELERLGIAALIEHTDAGPRALAAEDGKSVCFHCARQRRNRLFDIARERGARRIAFGHHKDDILETFFLNLLYGGSLGTMLPRQDIFSGRISIIRPMAYLEKTAIRRLAQAAGIRPVKNPCPHDTDSRRQEARRLLAAIEARNPGAKGSIFAALGNVRKDYLLGSRPSPE